MHLQRVIKAQARSHMKLVRLATASSFERDFSGMKPPLKCSEKARFG